VKAFLPILCALIALPSAATAANLIFNDVRDHAKVIAYELPAGDGRAEAIRYIESVRDDNKKGVPVLDVAANRASLKDKLKGGFILYTTLGDRSSVLRLATRQLGWSVAEGSFHFRDITAPAGDVKFILVGRNPYGRGYCAIYAAGSNRGLPGIHDLYDGPASYQISQGDRMLREGSYDEQFVPRERVPKAAALEDVNQFFTTMRRVHPNLLGKIGKENYAKLKQQTVDGIAARLDSKGEIPTEDLASLLYFAGASFKDGHTAVHWGTKLNEWNTRGNRFPAFRLAFDNGRFMIAGARDQTIVGTELMAVNGAPVVEFLRPILDRCSGETLPFRMSVFTMDEALWYYMTNLFGGSAPYLMQVRDSGGQSREVTLETLNFHDYRGFLRHSAEQMFHPNDRGIKVEFFDSGATAHFLYPSFHQSVEEKRKMDQVFEEIQSKGSRNLILDIRDNLGGQSSMGEHLFGYIYGEKFRLLRQVRIKASRDVLPHVPWWARPIVFLLSGHVMGHSISEHAVPRPKTFFSGRTFLLVDNGSYSMASSVTTMFRDYKAGTILGYETGGLPVTFGEPVYFTLKNSRIRCSVSATQILPPQAWPGDEEHGVIPDVPLNEGNLAEFKNERDPALAFTLRYIKTGAAPAITPSNASSAPAKK
jgi:hypothetical protein